MMRRDIFRIVHALAVNGERYRSTVVRQANYDNWLNSMVACLDAKVVVIDCSSTVTAHSDDKLLSKIIH